MQMNEPKLRFKADDGSQFPEWEKKKISDIFSKVKEKNKDGQNQNVITNSAEFGLINQRDFFDKDIAVDGKTENYTVIKTGDFVYNPRKSKQAPYGPFNCYHLERDGIVSPLYTCLRPKGIADNKYLQWYFQSGSWYRFIYENGAQNGARHDRVGMTDSLMQEIPVHLPQLAEEQQKIAEFLSTIDTVIAKQKETVSAWEERKKGVMQKLFSQEVRFKADDESDFPEWEEKTLSEIASFHSGLTYTPDDVVDSENGVLVFRSSNIQNGRICYDDNVYVDKELKEKNYVRLHDIVVCVRNGSKALVGKNALVTESDLNATWGAFMTVIRTKQNYEFVHQYLNSAFFKKEMYKDSGTATINQITTAMLNGCKLLVPSLPEQQKIADCLSSLDDVIEKQKVTLAAWGKLKKGLLQQMFV
jgi:type I restriction enzyme S subunit